MARNKFVATHIITGNNETPESFDEFVHHGFSKGEFVQASGTVSAGGNGLYFNKGRLGQYVSDEHVRPVYVPPANLSAVTV
jgi:hypothetical protein